MGGRIEVLNPRRSGAEPVADLVVQASALHGIEVPAGPRAARDRRVSGAVHRSGLRERRDPDHGAEELRVKESDRIAAMSAGLQRSASRHAVPPDGMRIAGRDLPQVFGGGEVDSRGDHRIAMSFSVASLRAAAPIASATLPTWRPHSRASSSWRAARASICMNDEFVITIDGPSGSGKGTVSRAVARRLGWALLDSGALYRLVAFGRAPGRYRSRRRIQACAARGSIWTSVLARPKAARRRFGSPQRTLPGRSAPRAPVMTPPKSPPCRRYGAALLDRQRRFAVHPGLVADGRAWEPWYSPGRR